MHNDKKDVLLDALLKYIIPVFNGNKTKDNKKQGRLEELVRKDKKAKSGLKPPELIFLEDFIDSFLRNNANNKAPIRKIEKIESPGFFDDNSGIRTNWNDEEEIKYSVAFERKKGQKGNAGYSVEIKYEENETEERLSIKIRYGTNKPDDCLSDKKPIDYKKQQNNPENSNNEYAIILTKEKNNKEDNKTKNNPNDNYSITLVYENGYERERLSIQYRTNKESYLKKREQALHDFSDRVPGKHVSAFSRNEMPGVLGFTYLGQDRMALRDDLTGKTRKMVDIHESIHTPDEYETRVLTDWIMSRPKIKYFR